MFLLRCLFWLGLVFSQIAQHEGTYGSALVGQATMAAGGQVAKLGPLAAGQAAGLGRMAANAAEQRCRAEPTACLALAAQAANALKPDAVAASSDTLSASDRAPAWRSARTTDKHL